MKCLALKRSTFPTLSPSINTEHVILCIKNFLKVETIVHSFAVLNELA